jgi:hypothetical protein
MGRPLGRLSFYFPSEISISGCLLFLAARAILQIKDVMLRCSDVSKVSGRLGPLCKVRHG